jgi:ABC-2 type transport system permease protein
VRLAWLHLRVAALNEFQYRINFFVQLINSLIAFGTGLVAIALVYSHTQDLGGWTQYELLAVMGVHILLGGVIRAVVEPNMTKLMEDVQQGTLDYSLTRPADAQLLISVRQAQVWQAIDVMLGLGVVVYSAVRIGASLGWLNTVGFVLALLMGTVIVYCLWLLVTTLAFKLVDVDNMIQMLSGVYQAGRWPVTVYPTWLRGSLTFIVPLAFAVTVPAEAVTSRLEPITLVWALLLTTAFVVIARLVWKWGLRNYTGASA